MSKDIPTAPFGDTLRPPLRHYAQLTLATRGWQPDPNHGVSSCNEAHPCRYATRAPPGTGCRWPAPELQRSAAFRDRRKWNRQSAVARDRAAETSWWKSESGSEGTPADPEHRWFPPPPSCIRGRLRSPVL